MDPISSMVASGLRTRFQSLDMLGNNLANAASRGFKADREFYSLFTGEDSDAGGMDVQATMPTISKAWTDHTQGLLQTTDNPQDMAISGKGFFGIQGPNGPLYTRNGSIELSSTGELKTADGYAFRSLAGASIRVTPGRPFEIDRAGVVRQNGNEVGRLEVVDFAKPEQLTKFGRSYFKAGDGVKSVPVPYGTEVRQGQIESSNVATAEGAVHLVGVLRQFEALQKAAGVNAEMSKKVWDEVARVG